MTKPLNKFFLKLYLLLDYECQYATSLHTFYEQIIKKIVKRNTTASYNKNNE